MLKQNKISITSIFPKLVGRRNCAASGRTCAGFGMVEAFTSAIFIVVSVIVSLDCWFMIMAARINDSACRDAARAAAQAGVSSSDATNAAMAAAQAYAYMGQAFMVAPPTITVTAYNNTGVSPSVTVQSTCTVRTLIPFAMLDSAINNNITFTDTKTYPIIPSTAGVQANNINAAAAGGGGG